MIERFIGDEYLTIKDVCDMFDVTQVTVYKWRRDLNLPCIRISGDKRAPVRFVRSEVEEWAKEHGKTIIRQPQNSDSSGNPGSSGGMGKKLAAAQ